MIIINSKTNIKSLEKYYLLVSKNKSINISISKGLSSADFGLIPM
jgi:hypothetical protein